MKDEQLASIQAVEMASQSARQFRALTPARIALRTSGVSLATPEVLNFQLAHAQARDAVHATLQAANFLTTLRQVVGISAEILSLHSAARNRQEYLQRPDLGRILDDAGRTELQKMGKTSSGQLVIVIADGLSALAVERNAAPLLMDLLPLLTFPPTICLVQEGRVAIGDEIGAALGAQLVIVLIGERPGLSSPDSLGAYITWQPRPGRTDAERNCISNIRTEGLDHAEAARRLAWFVDEAQRMQSTGISLKEAAHWGLLQGDA